ncbi:MAG TPA: hypothetical protein HPP76_08885 [Desulfuromonadales bacterium]|nr:hypothetical protein [Desulfuromonadales bacterium]
MAEDLRYKIQHLGDTVAGALDKTVCLAKSSAKGIFLTYDINRLERSKRILLRDIGARVVHLSGEGLTDVRRDDRLNELMNELTAIEKEIQTCQLQKDDTLQTCTSSSECCSDNQEKE